MKSFSLAVALAAALAIAAPAGAATPASGTISLASPTVSWSGTANGYLFRTANEFTGACEAPFCDSFALTLAEAGQLTVTATARTGAGFTRVEILRPDGSYVGDGGTNSAASQGTNAACEAIPPGGPVTITGGSC